MRTYNFLYLVLSSSFCFAQQTLPSDHDQPKAPNWPPGAIGPIVEGVTPIEAPSPAGTHKVPALDTSIGFTSPSEETSTSNSVQKFVSPPPPINLLSGTDSTLTTREVTNIATAKRWVDGPKDASRELAASGENGAIVFRFGASMPSIVCAPLHICDIAFQAGETINTVQVGDPVRWKITPATSGAAPSMITHATVKALDIGLSTNLLVTTDRRTYSLKLVSRKDDYMPTVSFSYPEEETAAWAALAKEREQVRAATVIPETGQSLSSLDFGYRIAGDKPIWRPLRVYTDGIKTYIQFPRAMQFDESPALVALGTDDKEQMVNYRVSGERYVVDKVLSHAMLVSGVGRKQIKVKIEHKGEI